MVNRAEVQFSAICRGYFLCLCTIKMDRMVSDLHSPVKKQKGVNGL